MSLEEFLKTCVCGLPRQPICARVGNEVSAADQVNGDLKFNAGHAPERVGNRRNSPRLIIRQPGNARHKRLQRLLNRLFALVILVWLRFDAVARVEGVGGLNARRNVENLRSCAVMDCVEGKLTVTRNGTTPSAVAAVPPQPFD